MADFKCSVCGEEHPKHEQYSVDGRLYCPRCADWLTTNCIHCGKRIMKASNMGVVVTPVCAECGNESGGKK